jgi:nitroreductase
MDFTKVIETRRSVRAYADKAIPDEVLHRVLEAARLAPSANNSQPWRFIVVKDGATRAQIAKAANDQLSVTQAPVVIVCCGKHSDARNVGIAIEHLALAARNEGLGTCWIGWFDEQPVKKLVGVPAEQDIIILLPMGYPASDDLFSATAERLPLDQIVFWERFGKQAGK